MEQTIVTAKHLQDQLWEQAVLVAKTVPTAITSLFILSLNETIDPSEKRLATLEDRVPLPIWVMLTLVSLLACLTVA